LDASRIEETTMTRHVENKPPDPQRVRSVDASRADRQRSLDAMHVLESMASSAAGGREGAWRAEIVQALQSLSEAIAEQERTYDDPAGLFTELALEHPRLRTWIRQLRRQWQELAATTAALAGRLSEADDAAWNPADVREQLRWLMTSLHHHRAREADLVFEALTVDLGAGD
jgi:hypothetical protein